MNLESSPAERSDIRNWSYHARTYVSLCSYGLHFRHFMGGGEVGLISVIIQEYFPRPPLGEGAFRRRSEGGADRRFGAGDAARRGRRSGPANSPVGDGGSRTNALWREVKIEMQW